MSEADIRRRLIGTWKLVSSVREELDSGKRTDSFGPNPVGFITYGADGRMMVINVRSDRKRPAGPVPTAAEAEALFRGLLAYAGTYAIAGNEITHHVEVSWNELQTGQKLVRVMRFEGNRMHLSTHPEADPADGVKCVRTITWEKLAT